MSSAPGCDRQLFVQAELDGELDAAQSLEATRHRVDCAQCAQLHDEFVRVAAALREAPRFTAPAALRASVAALAPGAAAAARGARAAGADAPRTRPPRRRLGARAAPLLAGIALGAAAASLATLWLRAPAADPTQALIDSHLRALQTPSHLLDVASTEHHVVKPWFAGQLEFAPPVKDLAAEGYPLRGGRVDVIGGRAVAVLVYEAGRHTVDVFVWPRSAAAPAAAERTERGFHLRAWDADDMHVSAVSDLDPRELETFVARWNAAR